MRICISGGMGFIGSHTVQLAVSKHHDISVIDNESSGFTKVRGVGKYYKGSITEIEFVANVFREFKPEAVIHLAAQPSLQTSIDRPQFDAKVNIIGSINMAKCAEKYGAKIIFSSTSAVYCPDANGIYHELSLTRPQCPYGVSKLAAENYIRILCKNWVILRYGNVFGPRQVPLGENQFVPRAIKYLLDDEMKDFKINGDGKQERDFIPVEDVANANILAVEKGNNVVLNIGTGKGTNVNTMYEYLQTVSGIRKEVTYGPEKPGELRKVILNSEHAFEVLGWKAKTPFEETLRDAVEWIAIDKRRRCKGCPK